MDIAFRSKGLSKVASSRKEMNKKLGSRTADLLSQRLAELQAAETLDDLRALPGPRCHELKGDRKGQLAVDLDHPRRLVFEPAADPPRRADGGLDWNAVDSIVVVEIADYH